MSSPAGAGARPPIWSRRWWSRWLGGRERSEGNWTVNGPEQRDGWGGSRNWCGEDWKPWRARSVEAASDGVETWMEQRRLCLCLCALSVDRETRRESLLYPEPTQFALQLRQRFFIQENKRNLLEYCLDNGWKNDNSGLYIVGASKIAKSEICYFHFHRS